MQRPGLVSATALRARVCVCPILTLSNSLQESEEGADHGGRFVCPLCTLDFSSPEKLISHVYQVRARDLNRTTLLSLLPAALLSVDTLFSRARLRPHSTPPWWAAARATCARCVGGPSAPPARWDDIFSYTPRTDCPTAPCAAPALPTPTTSTG